MQNKGFYYYVLNKPVNMVSQFVSSHEVGLLGDLDFYFPEGTHAIGRLDNHSEGLLLLSTNKKVTRLLFSDIKPHKRVYLVQVNNQLDEEKIERLRNGVTIRIKNGEYYTTPACDVELVPDPVKRYPHIGAEIAYGQNSWMQITLTEGKYHQVRKMVAAIRHRCKRLIRLSIEDISLEDLAPGQVREMSEDMFFKQLQIQYP
jgi:23S rRNA pseudouridine2457 synthase